MKILIITFLTLTFFTAFSQKIPPPIIFGEIPLKDLQMKVYEKDSSVGAIILCDYGTYYNGVTDTPNEYTKHLRIKIFRKSGYEQIPKFIDYYAPKNTNKIEIIDDFVAATYNLENGITKTYPLEKKDIFIQKNEDGNNKYSFALPQVREGSIIEISYTLKTNYQDFPTWNFQHRIPVLWSEIRITHPRSLNYDVTLQSDIPLTINENDQKKNSILIKYCFAMANISALKDEPFITTIEDYRSKLDFELAASSYAGRLDRNYSLSWEALNDNLLKSPYFGLHIPKFTKASDVVFAINDETKDTLTKAKKVYQYIQKHMKWNENERLSIRMPLNECFEKQKGGCSEINLMLIKTLQDVGIKANPVILSTRDNGKLSNLILQEKYNYVIAQFVYQGKNILLDATEKSLPFGSLPFRCLNERGRLVDNKGGAWIDLKPTFGRREVSIIEMSFLKDNKLKGSINFSFGGYSAANLRSTFNTKGKKDFTIGYKKSIDNIEFDSLSVQNLDSLDKPLEFKIQANLKEAFTEVGALIYFNPMLSMGENKNPFQPTERQLPIDLGVTQESIFIANFNIPDGYTVESIPKYQSISLPNEGGKFIYGVQIEGNIIKVNSKISLKKTLYPLGEYQPLREFYNRIITKQQEQIVLKRK